ncbi:MAG: transketolase [Candidatus Yonathbacteria bacterium RIFCSPLOWO2_01_FULL_47_33b]|uniref:Transketolase n=1 Tax=Candidatus Yonathbacteria bacterium RIFCSPLOWO2_01_FULL_47_33b TaxID=1802727 RepID=A0A1G2SF28_9BACT|nr:MAG: transketolase [Candidatus Yonathbacteria bacterium RIFCSPLOWO2_01_FULL_47_33b]
MNLNPKLFDADVEQAPIRQGFGEGLLEAGRADERVVAMCCDLTESTKMDAFAKEFPQRFFEMGIMEQSAASVASGMAAMGKIPFVSSYAMFSPGRNWEQIRTTICYNDRPVKIVGSHAGVSVGPDGGTHQAVEDIALTRVIPRMVVITPCDSIEAKKATLAMAKTSSPTYIRLAREKTPIITTVDTPFEIGKAQIFYRPEGVKVSVGIIACGSLVYNAIMAAHELAGEGIGAVVMNIGTVKPMDREAVIALAKECGAIVTVEEHQVAGGMGSAVAEILAVEHPTRMKFVGVQDEFGQSGTPLELIEHYGMGKDSIKEAVKSLI